MKNPVLLLTFLILVVNATPGRSQALELSGELSLVQIDHDPLSGLEPDHIVLLTDDEGRIHRVLLSPEHLEQLGGPSSLRGRRAILRGDVLPSDERTFALQGLEFTDGLAPKSIPQPTSGSQPCVTLLFKYSDISDETEPKSYFEDLVSGPGYPSIDHYFREISYDIVDLIGSEVHGWYELDHPYDHYNRDIDEDGNLELDVAVLLPECLGHADADVNYPDFDLINLMFNGKMSCNVPATAVCAFSQADQSLLLDGVWKSYGLTYQGPWAIHRQDVIPHEMLHTFGVPHSSGPYAETYDSGWDIMSGAQCTTFGPPHPVFGCLGAHTIAWHKVHLGWIPPARIYDTGLVGAGMASLDRLALPTFAVGTHLMTRVAVSTNLTELLTIEYRTHQGYDGASWIPGEAVILHLVDILRSDRLAQVIDASNNGDPNDEGAMWRPGETMLDAGRDLIVHVENWNASHASVSFSNAARPTTYVDWSNFGAEDGSYSSPWNSAVEGYASVYENGSVYLRPGIYAETFRSGKACVLRKGTGFGSVRIGQGAARDSR